MSISFIEGFDWPATIGELDLKWSVTSPGQLSLVDGKAGAPSQAVRFASTGSSARLIQTFKDIRPTKFDNERVTMGFSINISGLPGSDCVIWAASEPDTVGRASQLEITTTGTIKWTRTSTDILETAAVLTPGAWAYVEFEVTVDDGGTGELSISINGTTVSTATNIRNTNADGWPFWEFEKSVDGFTMDIDDVYLGDPSIGSAHTGIKARANGLTVETLIPDADGATNAWTTSSGNRFDRIDTPLGTAHDGDTTFIEDQTNDDLQLFTLPATAQTLASYAVAVNVVGKKNSGGGKSCHAVVRSAGANDVATQPLGFGSSDYTMQQEVFDQDDNNGSPQDWTVTAFDAAEFGVQMES